MWANNHIFPKNRSQLFARQALNSRIILKDLAKSVFRRRQFGVGFEAANAAGG